MDTFAKERLIEEFRACLDTYPDTFEQEGEAVDLHTLLSELAALKNEVRLESRQFKSALDELRAAISLLREQNERLTRDLDRSRELANSTRRQTERQMLLEVLDLRDRIEAGLTTILTHRASVWARLLVRGETRFTKTLGEGFKLTLNRLDRLLESYRVRPIEALDRPLDPHLMNAVGVQSLPKQAEGIVVVEQRRGYFYNGELLRSAEVIVNKRKNLK